MIGRTPRKPGQRFYALLVGAGLLLPQFLWAAQPVSILPAEIPLDVNAIYHAMQPAAEYGKTTQAIMEQMVRNHYSHIQFNDSFSGKMLDGYLKSLDGSRVYFTQADINEFEQFRTKLDDQLKSGDVKTGYLMFNRFNQRIIERLVYSIKRVEVDPADFDFTVDESIELDRSKASWPADHAALEDIWHRQVKSAVLSLKLTDKPIAEVRELLAKRFRFQLSQVLRTNTLDVYQRYMDAMTMAFDPHTQYFAPRAAENFNMQMRLSLDGIGAVLTTEDEYTKVDSIVTGGPADKQSELHPEDRIVGVAQGDKQFVDIVGWRVDDVVDLVRGEKGSVVRLNVLPKGSKLDTKVISITRDKVKLEDQSAKSEIVEVEYGGAKHKIGVIDLPTFYADFEAIQRRDPDYKSSAHDVQRLLEKLKADNVEGVVMDLRNNGGGALTEASDLVGLFVKRGPTVQVKDAEGEITVLGNPDSDTSWDGPLAVLVNRMSASASEIFAGAIQDYQRGLVLGSQSFGKGTVQELIPLGEGQIKITRSKFYRISGESTQHKGVTPNIAMPDLFEVSDEIGENALPTALPWDTIEANFFRPYADFRVLVPTLNGKHEARMRDDPEFVYIRAQIAEAKKEQASNSLSLNETKLLEERKLRDQKRLQMENQRRKAKGLAPFADIKAMDNDGITASDDDQKAAAGETAVVANDAKSKAGNSKAGESPPKAGKNKKGADGKTKPKEPDPYVIESGRILIDLAELQGGKKTSVTAQK
ncbi:MAG: carboxy terminal-processing peptidase [Gammaproteobacteria bacterium]